MNRYTEKEVFEILGTEIDRINKLLNIKKRSNLDYYAIGILWSAFKESKKKMKR